MRGDFPPESDPLFNQIVTLRTSLRDQMIALMDEHQLDALVYPTVLTTPALISAQELFWDSQFYNTMNMASFLGFPAITVPAGFTPDGIPVGVELMGRPFSEPTLLKLAYSFEQGTHHRLPPPSTPPLPGETLVLGDTNSDYVVDLADLNNVRNNFGGSGVGDTNADNLVDLVDLNNVRNFFGVSSGAQPVPEPASFVLAVVMLGISALFVRRARWR